jgi:hypothetical protein
MANIETSIYTYLLTQTAITAYVGTDIFPIDADTPPETDYIRFNVVVPRNDSVEFGDKTSAQPMIQFDVFSKRADNALAISNLLVTAFHGFSGSLGSGLNTVTTSSARGPMVIRDTSTAEWNGWYHGIVEWEVEYTRI